MSYIKPIKENNYYQKLSYTKSTIKNENEEERNKSNNYDDESLNEVIKSFEYFDINHNGKISVSELIKVLSSFGNIMTEDEIYNIFKAADINLNNNEEIDYIQFVNFWIGNH